MTEASLSARRNLLIDRASWDVGKSLELIEQLRNAGYRLEFHIAAVPLETSTARVRQRFAEHTARSGFGRFISDDYREQTYVGLAASVAEIERLRRVDALYLYDSEQNEVYSNVVANGEWLSAPLAPEVLSRHRGGH